MKKTTQVGEKGRYQDVCERLCKDLKATAVVLIVIEGRKGTGMSVSVDPDKPGAVELAMGPALGDLLRSMADRMGAGQLPEGIGFTSFDPENEA